MSSSESTSERPENLGRPQSSGASAESSWWMHAQRGVLLGAASLSVFAILLGIMFTIVSVAGLYGVLGVIAVMLLLTGLSVTVQQRHRHAPDVEAGHDYAPTA